MSTDFSSIDKLVEFGMGLAVARQMIDTMNQSMAGMNVPGINTSLNGTLPNAQTATTMWYVAIDGKQAGPFNDEELKRLINNRTVNANTLIWSQGMKGWTLAENVPEINKLILLAGAPL